MLFLHKPLVIDDGTRENVTVAAAARERILGTFRDADLRVVANGHVHRYRCTTDGDVIAVWAPSLSFSPAAEPHLKFGPGTAGIVEYSIRGRQVGVRFVEVPGIEGVAEFLTLPEVEQSMEALDRRSALCADLRWGGVGRCSLPLGKQCGRVTVTAPRSFGVRASRDR